MLFLKVTILLTALFIEDPRFNKGDLAIISEFNINLLQKPHTRSATVVNTSRGDTVIILDNVYDTDDQARGTNVGDWYFVKTSSGHRGWIFRFNLKMPTMSEDELIQKLYTTPKERIGAIIMQLGLMRSQKAKQHFIKILDTTSSNNYMYIEALGTYKDMELIPIFVKYLSEGGLAAYVSLEALGNYLDISLAEYIIPYLDDDADFQYQVLAQRILSRLNNDSLNKLLVSKKDNLVPLFNDLHKAYREQDIGLIKKHLDKENGFYLILTREASITYEGRLSYSEAVRFLDGKSKIKEIDSDYFTIHNIQDFEVTAIYSAPELTIISEPNEVKYSDPPHGFFTEHKVVNYEKELTIYITWKGFRNTKFNDFGAYFHIIRKGDAWFVVGFNQAY
jgi:hypothetical protein